MTQANKMTA